MTPRNGQPSIGDMALVKDRIDPDRVQLMMAFVIRHPRVFLEARQLLLPEHFQVQEGSYHTLWQTACMFYDNFGKMVPVDIVKTELAKLTLTMPTLVQDVMPILNFDWTALDDNENYGMDLLKWFLTERAVNDPLSSAMDQSRGLALGNPSNLLDRLMQVHARIASVGSIEDATICPTGWRPQIGQFQPTGESWLDRLLDGGTFEKQTYGLLGPFGSFKTGLAVQLSVNAAKRQFASPTPGLVVYVVYEGGNTAIRLRGMSCAASMPFKRLRMYYNAGDPLSRSNALEDYEIARYQYASPSTPRWGEVERLNTAVASMKHFRVVDMSGTVKNPSSGTGYVPEVAGAIDRLCNEAGLPLAWLGIDYAKLMARKHWRTHLGGKDGALRHLIGELPDEIRSKILERYGGVAWILQQMNAAANRKSAGAAQHHSDSAEASDFPENLWYAFTLSKVNPAMGHTIQFNATKTRDSEGEKQGTVLRIEGDANKVVPADQRYCINPATGKIMEREVAERFVEEGEQSFNSTYRDPTA
jgi:hypothetical protein